MARFDIPDGWTVQAYRFAIDPTQQQHTMLRSHCGAARFAFNHMLTLVTAVMDQRAAERSYGIADTDLTPSIGWSLPKLRKIWNQRKHEYAPWWAENSKEAYNTGLDALARSLDNWAISRTGLRAGKPVGFPRFKTAARSRPSVRFTTGTIRVESDRRHIVLPRLGRLRTHESTRKLARRVEAGSARILSATLSQDSRCRWYVSFQTLIAGKIRPVHARRSPDPVVGVDVGVKADALLVVAAPDGRELWRVPAPKPLAASRARLRALQRRAARQHGPYDSVTKTRRLPSKRWQATTARIGRTHGRAAAIRRDVLHKATTTLAQQHQVITVETLNVAGMRSAGGARKKGMNRALADAALAQIRQMLSYKTRWYGSDLVEADRWFPSSKTCSGCGGRKPNLTLADRVYECEHCGVSIDRDRNAAINLARLGDTQSSVGEQGPADSGSAAGRGARQETDPTQVGDAAGCEASTRLYTTSGGGKAGTVASEGMAA
ncbi:IS607 family element RNA-guided endonuclease TnpB [Nocardia sp. NPDC058518]|uniref:IS607 family element RNA-guided endonuclease TnpB n=1 Tax=Nocardia sp. NPDC058518 TaxID=3346534 RepID=UPI003657C231